MKDLDTAWIIVRAFGVYFLVHAFLELTSAITMLVNYMSSYQIINASTGSERATEQALYQMVRSQSYGIVYFAQTLVFAALSYYCLRKGRFIYKLLTYGGSGNEKP